MTRNISRRSVLGGIALGVTGTGAATFYQLSQPAAAVSVNELSIPGEEFQAEDGDLHAPWLRVVGEFEFALEEPVAEWRVELQVQNPDPNTTGQDNIGQMSGAVGSADFAGEYAVTGDITDSEFYSPSDFTVTEEGATQTIDVPIRVLLILIDVESVVMETAEATTTAPVTISNTGGETAIFLSGSGTIEFQDNEGDAPPM